MNRVNKRKKNINRSTPNGSQQPQAAQPQPNQASQQLVPARIKATNKPENPMQLSLISRELTMETSTDNYSQQVIDTIRRRIILNINIQNEVFTQKNLNVISFDEKEDSIEDLAIKALQGHSDICDSGHEKAYLEICTSSKYATKSTKLGHQSLDAYFNGQFCWRFLQTIYQKPKKNFPEYTFTQDLEGKIFVQNVDKLIGKAINELKDLVEESFDGFRILLDPRITLTQKRDKIFAFHPSIQWGYSIFSQTDASDCKINALLDATSCAAIIYTDNILMLQGSLKCLKEFQRAPKTIENSIAAYNALKLCYEKEYKHLEQSRTHSEPYLQNNYQVKALLRNFLQQFAKDFQQAINKNTSVKQIEAAPTNKQPTSKVSQTLQKQQPQKTPEATPIKSNNEEVNQKANTIILPSNSQDNTFLEKQNLPIEIPTPLQLKDKDIVDQQIVETPLPVALKPKNVIDQQPIETPTTFTPLPLKDQNVVENPKSIKVEVTIDELKQEDISDEDSLDDDIKSEEGLMEALRQLFEKDRAKKIKSKQQKLIQSKKTLIDEEKDLVAINKTETEITILSPNDQETLQALFRQPRPEAFKISGTQVQNLIKNLGGKCKGNSGTYYQIFWGNSNKKGGEYEVAHEQDRGFLSSEYASRVAQAIYLAVINNWAPNKDSIPADLLNIIKNGTFEDKA